MTPRRRFQELAVQHGLRDPRLVEIAEVAGLVNDVDTKEGREESLRRFREAKPHLFGADHGAKTVMEAMGHAEASGKSASQAKADRKVALDRHVGRPLERLGPQERRAVDMTPQEADALQREILGREQTNNNLAFQRAHYNHVLDG